MVVQEEEEEEKDARPDIIKNITLCDARASGCRECQKIFRHIVKVTLIISQQH